MPKNNPNTATIQERKYEKTMFLFTRMHKWNLLKKKQHKIHGFCRFSSDIFRNLPFLSPLCLIFAVFWMKIWSKTIILNPSWLWKNALALHQITIFSRLSKLRTNFLIFSNHFDIFLPFWPQFQQKIIHPGYAKSLRNQIVLKNIKKRTFLIIVKIVAVFDKFKI